MTSKGLSSNPVMFCVSDMTDWGFDVSKPGNKTEGELSFEEKGLRGSSSWSEVAALPKPSD